MTPICRDFLGWDVASWSPALRFWESMLAKESPLHFGLEIGAHQGGLSLFFASKFGIKMCCTDVVFPEKARLYHQKFSLKTDIEYVQADALRLPFAEHTFDFVAFKSVLGMVGSHGRIERIEQAIAEIHRVLKPGGLLFFAENLRGSRAHAFARKKFVPWGRHWHYLSLPELEALMQDFPHREIRTTGFFSAFVPRPAWLKFAASRLDQMLPFLPKTACYVGYGVARKA